MSKIKKIKQKAAGYKDLTEIEIGALDVACRGIKEVMRVLRKRGFIKLVFNIKGDKGKSKYEVIIGEL